MRAGSWKANTFRAGGAGCIDEVDRVYTVAAAALGVIEDVVEDSHATEIIVFTDLVRLIPKLGHKKLATGVGRLRGLVPARSAARDGMSCAPAPRMTPFGCGVLPLPAFPAV